MTLNYDEIKTYKIRYILFPAIILLAFIGLTTVNLPMQIIEALSPVRAGNLLKVLQEGNSFTITKSLTYYIPGSQFYLLYGLTLLVLFYFSSGLLMDKQNRLVFLWIITTAGGLEAVYGLVQTMFPGFLWTPAPAALTMYPTGTFANNDLYAAFLNMCWPVSMGFGFNQVRRLTEKIEILKLKKKRLDITDRIKLPFHYFSIPLWSSVLIIIAVILSRSTSGIIILFIFVLLCRIVIPFPRALKIIFSGIIYASLLLYGWYLGIQGIITRSTMIFESMHDKIGFWSDSLVMLKEHPFTGIGMDAYQFMAPLYMPSYSDPQLLAQNDYLEFLLELGLPVTSLLFLWLISALIYYLLVIVKMPRKINKMTTDEILIICSFYAFFSLVINITAVKILRTPVATFYAVSLLALLHSTLYRKDHTADYRPEHLFPQRKTVRFVPYKRASRKRRR